jgi:hypothetical protein
MWNKKENWHSNFMWVKITWRLVKTQMAGPGICVFIKFATEGDAGE